MMNHIGRRHLWHLIGLCVDPSQRLKLIQEFVFGQHVRKVHANRCTPLRNHHNGTDLLDAWVVWRADAVHVTCNLGSQIGDADKLLENVLRHHVRIASLTNVLRVHVDVIGTEMEIGGRNGTHAPVGLAREHLLSVSRGGGHNDLVAVHVGGLAGSGGQLIGGVVRVLLDLGDLLTFVGDADLKIGTEQNRLDFALCQRLNVHTVALTIVGQNQILQSHLDLDPLLVRESRPDVIGLCNSGRVGFQEDTRTLLIDVQRTQNQNQTRECSERRDGLQPVVIQVEQAHARLRCLQDQISEFFHLQTGLEGKLQLRALDHNVGKVKTMYFQRIQHALTSDNQLLGLLFDRQSTNKSSNLFGGLPLGQLTKTLLTGPHTSMNDLEEQLSGARIEDENGTINWFGGQVSFKGLMNGDAIHIGIINEPNDLLAEELRVVLRVEVGFRRL
mmetsp:Transcript_15391/g.46046  ORF Transcript_15391/g.46046 Transcript_15391/m.46046 type:complete len:443 (-) Transcript_15391:2814-4142(-)